MDIDRKVEALYADVPRAPGHTDVSWPDLGAKAEDVLAKAWAYATPQRALDNDVALTNIWSYTGHEREIAEYLVERGRAIGLPGEVQHLDETSANALVRLGPSGSTQLALFAPTDTHFSGDEQDDPQWGRPPRRDATLPAQVEGQTVIGLCSDNPKGLCAAILLALEALTSAGFEPTGQLVGAFVAGGAPARAPDGEVRKASSLGAGVNHLIAMGGAPDFAIYHKPGYQVSWEDHALNQFHISVHGDPTYMAMGGEYRVVEAACEVAREFNAWTQRYKEMQLGTFRPMAALNVIRVGRPDKPNWSSGVADLYADIRTAPGAPPALGRELMSLVIDEIAAKVTGVELAWEQVAYMPGGMSDPQNWIVQSAIRGALRVDGRKDVRYEAAFAGQTEAGLLQRLGVPTVKVHGMPPGIAAHPELPDDIREFTMSCAYAPHIAKAAQVMIYAAVDTLSRSRDEVNSRT